MLNGFYVFSHSFQSVNESAIRQATAQDFANLWEEGGPTDNDRRHVASISGIWNLDYYSGSNSLMKHVFNGWTISPIVSLQSGVPFNIVTGANNNFDSANANCPNLVPRVNPFLDRIEAAQQLRRNGSIRQRSFQTAPVWQEASARAEPTATHHATICARPVLSGCRAYSAAVQTSGRREEALSGKELAPICEIANSPCRIEERNKKVGYGAGGLVD
jgi:hypothetical protein